MKIMNRNLTGKLQELHGIQYEDTHVALTEIRGQLHQLTQRSVAPQSQQKRPELYFNFYQRGVVPDRGL